MRNRIQHLLPAPRYSGGTESHRPRLTLQIDRPFDVDMERFFDFTFSFAEALLDLEAQFDSEPKLTSMDRLLENQPQSIGEEFDYDIDARWM